MKIIEDGVVTSGELLKEFFSMSERMINNISEKVRYEKICEHLIRQGAKRKDEDYALNSNYDLLELEEEIYLIPNHIFDELDEEWRKELATDENSKNNSQVAL